MKNSIITIKNVFIAGAVFCSFAVNAGNEDRVGSAGASYMLANPWARGAAAGDAGIANLNGLEATFSNIAGLAFADKTQIKFNHSNWMGQAGIAFNSVGLAQRTGANTAVSFDSSSGELDLIDAGTLDIYNTGGGLSHNNMQPYWVFGNYFIYAGLKDVRKEGCNDSFPIQPCDD